MWSQIVLSFYCYATHGLQNRANVGISTPLNQFIVNCHLSIVNYLKTSSPYPPSKPTIYKKYHYSLTIQFHRFCYLNILP